ncbi:MAG: DUF2924 domain-containing protein [Candidatus Omnitrophica bacterium]|nr:DUF2924 domain-containing protein [Candidatus Omnitrophota bacterium]
MKKRKKKSLILERLENVSKRVFKEHSELITGLVGTSPGVYALYDDMGLYYVGKSGDLKNRVQHHLKDKHRASWTHFSLYLLRHQEHAGELESLLIRIADPRGNKVKPKGKSDEAMLNKLKTMVKHKQEEEFEEMFVGKRRSKKDTRINRRQARQSLAGLVVRNTKLFRTYKGKEHSSVLTPQGKIKIGNKLYTSPSGASKSIVKHAANGWRFWYLKDSNNDVISLDELRNEQ